MTVEEALQLPRVAICGGCDTGKTTLAMTAVQGGRPVIHTDDFLHLGIQEGLGQIIADSLAETPAFVLEGVKAANALRAGLEVDAVIWLEAPYVLRSDGQERQAKAVRTVFNQWLMSDGGKTPVVNG